MLEVPVEDQRLVVSVPSALHSQKPPLSGKYPQQFTECQSVLTSTAVCVLLCHKRAMLQHLWLLSPTRHQRWAFQATTASCHRCNWVWVNLGSGPWNSKLTFYRLLIFTSVNKCKSTTFRFIRLFKCVSYILMITVNCSHFNFTHLSIHNNKKMWILNPQSIRLATCSCLRWLWLDKTWLEHGLS